LRLPQSALLLGGGNGWGDRDRHRLCDLVLHSENVGEIAVIALGPNVLAGFGLDELRSNADAVAGFAQAALEHIPHRQLAPDLLHIDHAAFIREGRIASDDEERRIPGQNSNDLLDHAVGEIFLLGVAGHILEWHHRQRWLIRQWRHSVWRKRRGIGVRHAAVKR
jgi:hypothetical protein